MVQKDIKSMSLEELKQEVVLLGEKPYRAAQMYEWMHRKLCTSLDEMTNIPNIFRQKCKEAFFFPVLHIVKKLESALDGTCKFLFQLPDGNVIESVLMKYHHGNSVCISSQVGCRMGCLFCASTLGGLVRNLTPAEMLEQIYRIQENTGERVSNVVVMGTGEPLDNYDNLIKFIHMISDEGGLHISQRNITISTCGIAERVRQLADEELAVNLALSLHAPNQEGRKKIMPISAHYELGDVLEAFDYYYSRTGRRLTFEYSLIAGVNDSPADAGRLAALLKGKNCLVNLIPVNTVKERNFVRSRREAIENFKNVLEKNRINATIRREMGADINAACGQLRKNYIEREKEEGVNRI